MKQTILLAAASVMALSMAVPALAETRTLETEHYAILVEPVLQGLEHPWAIALLPDGRFLVTERNSGQLRLGTPDGTVSDPLEGTPEIYRYEGETERSQAGLFDIKLHPDFAENQYVYLSYARPTERGTGIAVDRGRLVEEGDAARLADVETIFEMKEDDQDASGLHFGGRMAFDPSDNSLYLSVGERRNISRAQDPADQAGSILRMTDAGEPHPDSPFIDEDDADPYVYSMGNRNPQGLTVHAGNGELWANDHGPLGGDEINRIEAGQNYGWPFITGGTDYSGARIGEGTEREGMVSAIHIFEETVAPSGLAIVDHDAWSAWSGDLLNGGLASESLVRVRVEDGAVVEEEWIEIGRRVRDVQIGEDGTIWLVTDHADGDVLRLRVDEG